MAGGLLDRGSRLTERTSGAARSVAPAIAFWPILRPGGMARPTDWTTVAINGRKLAAEASTVVAMRMAKLAAGDAAAVA